jgi:uncharacterized protein involved in cysteine biosynthesis
LLMKLWVSLVILSKHLPVLLILLCVLLFFLTLANILHSIYFPHLSSPLECELLKERNFSVSMVYCCITMIYYSAWHIAGTQ